MSLADAEVRLALVEIVGKLRVISQLDMFLTNVPGEFEHRTRLRYDLNNAANAIEKVSQRLGAVKRDENGHA